MEWLIQGIELYFYGLIIFYTFTCITQAKI